VEVESRFGLPLLALSTPIVMAGLAILREGGRRTRAATSLFLLGALVAVLFGVSLSRWIATTRTSPQGEVPVSGR
jgi:hypothetical protein